MSELPLPPRPVVLVVDDEPIVRNVFVNVLSAAGFPVLEAASSQEALDLCGQPKQNIAVVVVDYVLTDGTGTALAERIREHCPDSRLLLTSGTPTEAWQQHDQRRLADLGGRTDFLQKPFLSAELVAKVKALTQH